MEVDVQCPDGVYEGESILVNFGETQFNVQIPPGVLPGDGAAVRIMSSMLYSTRSRTTTIPHWTRLLTATARNLQSGRRATSAH